MVTGVDRTVVFQNNDIATGRSVHAERVGNARIGSQRFIEGLDHQRTHVGSDPPVEDPAEKRSNRGGRCAGDQGKFCNPEKFGDLGNGLFEFKSFRIRLPFAYAKNERGLILITHGFFKKKDKTPKEEITRAWRIYGEDQARTRLAIVRKSKR